MRETFAYGNSDSDLPHLRWSGTACWSTAASPRGARQPSWAWPASIGRNDARSEL